MKFDVLLIENKESIRQIKNVFDVYSHIDDREDSAVMIKSSYDYDHQLILSLSVSYRPCIGRWRDNRY